MTLLAQGDGGAAGALAGGLGLVCVGSISLVIYFIPLMVALLRGHHNTLAIGALNVFLGWTFLGWVIALVWSFTQVNRSSR
ncbi:MAG TPA: superinfection immunity protein [Planctomycetaceae bacterium]|nr:superinfection immunity protein [Planctomycetaceae bacterium]